VRHRVPSHFNWSLTPSIEQLLQGRYYRLELTLCDSFLPRRLNITAQYLILLVCREEKNTLIDKDAAYVVIALFLCSKKKKKIRLLSKDRYKRRPQY
jgi:hypothetical protein